MEEKIGKGDSTPVVIAKTGRKILFGKDYSIVGILLIIVACLFYACMTFVNYHFDQFAEFTRKVDMATTMMIRNNDLMERNIELSVKHIAITEANNVLLDKNKETIKKNNYYLDRNKNVLESTTREIIQNNKEMLKNLNKIREKILK